MPERSESKRRGCRQANSGAQRRGRKPGGAALSPNESPMAHGKGIAVCDTATARPRLMSRDMADAAREAPAKRRGRKIDSLSAATKGLTASILRSGLRCVNGAAAGDLESGVQGLLRTLDAAREHGKTRRLAQGSLTASSENRWHVPMRATPFVAVPGSRFFNRVRVSCRFNPKVSIGCSVWQCLPSRRWLVAGLIRECSRAIAGRGMPTVHVPPLWRGRRLPILAWAIQMESCMTVHLAAYLRAATRIGASIFSPTRQALLARYGPTNSSIAAACPSRSS